MSRAGASRVLVPRGVVEHQRAALRMAVIQVAQQAAMEAGLSVSRGERAIRFTKQELVRLLYLNVRYGSAAFDTKTGEFQDRA